MGYPSVHDACIIIYFQYEHKIYGTKKEKTELSVAVTGIKVVHREEGKRKWITQHVSFFLNMFCIVV